MALLTMRWHDLLFAHWPIHAGVLRPLVPAGLELDTFDGAAWLGVVPFGNARLRPLGLPLPGEAIESRQNSEAGQRCPASFFILPQCSNGSPVAAWQQFSTGSAEVANSCNLRPFAHVRDPTFQQQKGGNP